MAIKGVAEFYEGSGKKHIVTTQTESAWHVALGQPQGQKINYTLLVLPAAIS